MSGLLLVLSLLWLASSGLTYLTLMLATLSRYSLGTERSRIPQMLSIGIRFGVLALACIASCLALLLFDVTTRAFAQSIDPLPETAGALAWYGMQIGPFAVVTMIPMGIMWIWMKRLRREVV